MPIEDGEFVTSERVKKMAEEFLQNQTKASGKGGDLAEKISWGDFAKSMNSDKEPISESNQIKTSQEEQVTKGNQIETEAEEANKREESNQSNKGPDDKIVEADRTTEEEQVGYTNEPNKKRLKRDIEDVEAFELSDDTQPLSNEEGSAKQISPISVEINPSTSLEELSETTERPVSIQKAVHKDYEIQDIKTNLTALLKYKLNESEDQPTQNKLQNLLANVDNLSTEQLENIADFTNTLDKIMVIYVNKANENPSLNTWHNQCAEVAKALTVLTPEPQHASKIGRLIFEAQDMGQLTKKIVEYLKDDQDFTGLTPFLSHIANQIFTVRLKQQLKSNS